MLTAYIKPSAPPKWLHQNHAEYTGDFREGCLLDSFSVFTKRGAASIQEHYVNPNMSDYLVIWGSSGSGEAQKVLDDFYGNCR